MTAPADIPEVTLEHRVAEFLRAEAPRAAPPGLLEGILRGADARPATRGRISLRSPVRSPEWLGVGALAVLAVVAAVGALAIGGQLPGAGSAPGLAGVPSYQGIRFDARGLFIDAGSQRFTLDVTTASVVSDPGDPTYRTLEWTWTEHGVEMRLNLYFASDGATWWVSEIRAYDGRQSAEWLTASGTFFEGPLGQAYDGPAEVSLANGASTGRFYADRLVLLPTFPALQPATTRGPVPSSDGGPVLVAIDAPFAGGQLLHCIGAEAMTPQQVFLYARARGYPVEYRYERDSYSSNEEPPAGSVLTGASWGSQGQLLVFASPPDAPSVDQMRLTADRACPAAAPSK